MIVRYPPYFERFSCVAARCTDSCCKQWEVQVDEQAAARYRDLSGALGDDLRRHLFHAPDGEIYLRLVDGRCPMWRDDGLCRIQAACGHDMLCRTCREFPRLTHDYGDFIERGLELSCPEAARLILNAPPMPWVEKEVPGGEPPLYDRSDMDMLLQTRRELLKILADERRSVRETLALALLYGYHAQTLLDGGESTWDAEASLSFAKTLAVRGGAAAVLAFYTNLDILTEQWRTRLTRPQGTGQWDTRLRALARYGVERYFLQSISDLDLAGRVKMVVLSCVLVHLLGGDTEQTAQLYGKEIENSDENIDAILDGAYADAALTDDKLLGILLTDE